MRIASLVVTLILCTLGSFAGSTSPEQAQNIATFCKVWGFLKYHHPTVTSGKVDWDKEFTSRVTAAAALETREARSTYYSAWIASLGTLPVKKEKVRNIPDSLRINQDFSWISDQDRFDATLVQQFKDIRAARKPGNQEYVKSGIVGNASFKAEKAYADSVFPSAEMRMLSLSRYWNMIEYFFPYKYVIGEKWENVLERMVPTFRDAKDTTAYHLAMLELTASIHDSHGYLATPYIREYFGRKYVPFMFSVIEGKPVVTGFYNDSLGAVSGMQKGDVIHKVNGVPVEELMKQREKYIAASNHSAALDRYQFMLLNGSEDHVALDYERDGKLAVNTVNRFPFLRFNYDLSKSAPVDTVKMLTADVAYVNMGVLQRGKALKLLKPLKGTKAIIFDVRNYPQGSMYMVAGFLNNRKHNFATFTAPDFDDPGAVRTLRMMNCGYKNKDYYKGKVIILFNETTQSHAEFTCMALQTAPKVVSVGSQTSGADGNVSPIIFPGGYQTYMTGLGVFYPDGRPTQRVGIVPDVEVKPSVAGIRQGRDEVLEKAIEIANQ
ncbi:MAG: S41 family peptidase [Bacteroidota bacterium]